MTENKSPISPDPQQRLLELMAKQVELQQKEADRQELERLKVTLDHEAKVDRRKAGDAYMESEENFRYSKCDHRKGTAGKGRKFKVLDYMMGRYTFQNGVTRIKCEKCHFKWFPGDTRENAAFTMDNCLKKKRKPNPTKLSYHDAWNMTSDENTTNTPGRAEMVTTGPAPVIP